MCTMFLDSQYAVYKKLNCIVEVEKLFMYKIMFIYQICIKVDTILKYQNDLNQFT